MLKHNFFKKNVLKNLNRSIALQEREWGQKMVIETALLTKEDPKPKMQGIAEATTAPKGDWK
jgi:hypothetical protein